jgi:hypothetical protein
LAIVRAATAAGCAIVARPSAALAAAPCRKNRRRSTASFIAAALQVMSFTRDRRDYNGRRMKIRAFRVHRTANYHRRAAKFPP